jgi:MFS family permease
MLLALNQLQHLDAKGRLFILAAFSVAAAWGFVVWERRTAQPLIDLSFFRDRDFALVNAAHVVLNLSGFAVMLLVPFYLDRFSGLSVPETGAVLTASSVGLMLASPLAGRLAAYVPSRRLALLGAAAMALGQMLVGSSGPAPLLALLISGMAIQGAGLGLFQVAYFDIVTAAIPRQDRGVAGSLVMMTRTIGVVTGATVLMLAFKSLRAAATAGGMPPDQAFITGFQGAFHAATLLPVAVVAVALVCGWARAR